VKEFARAEWERAGRSLAAATGEISVVMPGRWLEQDSGWDKEPPAPDLPDHVIRRTAEKYLDAYYRLTGRTELP